MATDDSVKIDIIGGYLGAGKTTFMNKLLADGLASERVAIIENEFGDEPVDDAIVEGSGLEMRVLPSGCICCTLKADFMTSIEDIVARCEPDRILIEPTGLASPAELQGTCELAARMKGLPKGVRLNSMTAIVDATDAVEMIDYEIPVYMHQIEQAHLIVLSHAQELDSDALEAARATVAAVAPPHTPIIDAPWDQIDALEVLALSEQAFAESEAQHEEDGDEHAHEHDGNEIGGDPMRETMPVHGESDDGDGHALDKKGSGDGSGRARAHEHEHGHGHEHGHDHGHEHGHDHGHEHGRHHSYEGFASSVVTPTQPYDNEEIDRLSDTLRSQGVVRAKGFLPSSEGGLLHYEYVNGRASATPTTFSGPAKLVVISRTK